MISRPLLVGALVVAGCGGSKGPSSCPLPASVTDGTVAQALVVAQICQMAGCSPIADGVLQQALASPFGVSRNIAFANAVDAGTLFVDAPHAMACLQALADGCHPRPDSMKLPPECRDVLVPKVPAGGVLHGDRLLERLLRRRRRARLPRSMHRCRRDCLRVPGKLWRMGDLYARAMWAGGRGRRGLRAGHGLRGGFGLRGSAVRRARQGRRRLRRRHPVRSGVLLRQFLAGGRRGDLHRDPRPGPGLCGSGFLHRLRLRELLLGPGVPRRRLWEMRTLRHGGQRLSAAVGRFRHSQLPGRAQLRSAGCRRCAAEPRE